MKKLVFPWFAKMAVSALAILPIGAKAQVYTYPSSPTDWTYTFPVQQFDSSLGALTSVSLTLAETASFSWGISNFAPSSASFTLSASSKLTLTLPGLLGSPATTVSYSSPLPIVLGSGGSATVSTGAHSESVTWLLTSGSADLSAFAHNGGGTLLLPASALAIDSSTGSAGNNVRRLDTLAGALLEVEYNVPVPEPSELELMLPGFCLAVWILHRGRRFSK